MLKGGETKIGISRCSNLRLKIFIIGYKTQGESIVLLFIDTKANKEAQVKFSIVIDCYEAFGHNKTDEILRKYSVKTLSMLCWTHPHKDHTLGLHSLILKYCKETTQILIPEHLYLGENDIIKINNENEKEIFKKIFSLNRFTKRSLSNISTSPNGYEEIKSITFSSIDKDISVSINAVTPISSILSKQIFEKKRISPNDLSISLIITVDEYYIFLGGDTINQHIDAINQAYLEKCRFIKIPHHSSKTSNRLLDYLGEEIDTACTTTFCKMKLPTDDILNQYALKGDTFSTGYLDKGKNTSDYGIIEYEYDFSKEEVELKVKLEGNAMQFNV